MRSLMPHSCHSVGGGLCAVACCPHLLANWLWTISHATAWLAGWLAVAVVMLAVLVSGWVVGSQALFGAVVAVAFIDSCCGVHW